MMLLKIPTQSEADTHIEDFLPDMYPGKDQHEIQCE